MVCIGGQAHSHIKLQSVYSAGGVRDGKGQPGEQAEQRIPAHPHPGVCQPHKGWSFQSWNQMWLPALLCRSTLVEQRLDTRWGGNQGASDRPQEGVNSCGATVKTSWQ